MALKLTPALSALLAALAVAGSASADQRIYSYDPADDATRAKLGSGLTFVFDKGVFGMRVRQVLATEARASVLLEPASERELGARLDRILPQGAGGRELYLITDKEQGPGMVRAFCPGSTKGWLVFTPIRMRSGLVIHALGDDPVSGKARHCATLRLTFRGEWSAPPYGNAIQVKPFEPQRSPF